MADKTKIAWTNSTWNPIRNHETGGIGHYCRKVSPGCAHCYAERMQPRFKNKIKYNAADFDKGELFLDENVLTQPLRWKRPRMVFVCSMTDLFGEFVPFEFIDKVFAVMALCPQHRFQVLTKRPERMAEYFRATWTVKSVPAFLGSETETFDRRGAIQIRANGMLHRGPGGRKIEGAYHATDIWPLPNAWLGTSCENQEQANARIPWLLKCPAAVRFLSAEPLLEGIDFRMEPLSIGYVENIPTGLEGGSPLDWIIIGNESRGSRVGRLPNNSELGYWNAAESIVQQCAPAGVACFVKQGPRDGRTVHDLESFPPSCRVREWPQPTE